MSCRFCQWIVAFASIFLCDPALASAPQRPLAREWVRTYSSFSGKVNEPVAILLAPGGGVVVGAQSQNPEGDLDYQLIRYGANGEVAWTARLGTLNSGNDVLRGVAIDPPGNIFVTGTTVTAKYSAMGERIWTVSLSGRAIVANQEFVYLTGTSDIDISTVQLANNNTDGRENWRRLVDGNDHGTDFGQVITLDTAGNVYVAGQEDYEPCFKSGFCRRIFGLVSYRPDGSQRFYANTAGNNWPSQFALANSIALSKTGSIYVYGQYTKTEMLSTFDASGQNITNRLLAWNTEFATKMFLDPRSEDVLFTGGNIVNQRPYDTTEAPVVRFHGDQWTRHAYVLPSAKTTHGADIVVNSRGNEVLAGHGGPTATANDMFAVVLDANGATMALDIYDAPQHLNETTVGMVIDWSDNIYVTGFSATAQGGSEIFTIKYSDAATIENKPGGVKSLTFFTNPGQPYALEWTTNFINWYGLMTNIADANGVVQFDDTNATTMPYRFYRGNSAP